MENYNMISKIFEMFLKEKLLTMKSFARSKQQAKITEMFQEHLFLSNCKLQCSLFYFEENFIGFSLLLFIVLTTICVNVNRTVEFFRYVSETFLMNIVHCL